MTRGQRHAVLLAIVIGFAGICDAASWRNTGKPPGGSVRAVAVHPTNPEIVLISGMGLMRSEDGGETWSKVEGKDRVFDGGSGPISFSPSDPDTVYCILGAQLFASKDTGRTWKQVSRMQVSPAPLVVDPFDAKRIFLSSGNRPHTMEPPLLISEDGGRIFNKVKGLVLTRAERVACDPNHKGIVFCEAREDKDWIVALSRDHGETWRKISSPANWKGEYLIRCAFDPENKDTMFAHTIGTRSGKASYWFRYDDSEDWEIYYNEDSGISLTDDIRRTLERVFPPLTRLPNGQYDKTEDLCAAPSEPGTAFFCRRGLQRTLDGGKSWEDLTDRINFLQVSRLYVDPAGPDSCFCPTGGGLFHTEDLGVSWKKLFPERVKKPGAVYFHPHRAGTYFVGERDTLWMVQKGEDDSKLTKMHSAYNDSIRGMVFEPEDPDRFYCYRSQTLWTTGDGGKTWTNEPLDEPISGGLSSSGTGKPLALSFHKDQLRVYVPGKDTEELNLEETGKNQRNFNIRTAAVSPGDSSLMAFCVWERLFLTKDGGETWEEIRASGDLRGIGSLAFHPRNKGCLLIHSGYKGILTCDTEKGMLTPLGKRIPNLQAECLAVSADGKTYWTAGSTTGVRVYRTD